MQDRHFHTTGMFAALLLLAVTAGPAGAQFTAVAAGRDHVLALRNDGTLSAWDQASSWGLAAPPLPPGLTYVDMDGGGGADVFPYYESTYSVALRSDGAVVAWGASALGQSDVPALPPGVNYIQVDAGNAHAVALRSDGTVVAWGDNTAGQSSVPGLAPGVSYVEVAAGGWDHEVWYCSGGFGPPPDYYILGYSLARRSDGSIAAWGDNSFGQLGIPVLPAGVDFVELSAGSRHATARLSDGSVVAWGDNSLGQCNVPAAPPGLTYVEIAAGGDSSAARLSDGSIVTWGNDPSGMSGAPALPPGLTYIDVAVGGAYYVFEEVDSGTCSLGITLDTYETSYSHYAALRSDGSLVAWGGNLPVEVNAESYCSSTTNSTGCAATIRASGSPRLIVNDLVLVSNCVPDGPFLFFHGTAPQQVPFGNGFLCIGSGGVRILPWGSASGGTALASVDLPSIGITSPGVHNFQCIFRDPLAGGAGFNTSDAIEITFVP